MSYVKPYVLEFEKPIRLYLHDVSGTRSFISGNLIDAINPNLVRYDDDGDPYVKLHLDFLHKDTKDYHTYTFYFDVVETNGFDFVLSRNYLREYYLDSDTLGLPYGDVQVYQSQN